MVSINSTDILAEKPAVLISWNRYLYCRNDSVNFLDPTGKAANKAGMGDMPQESISGEPVRVEPYAPLPVTVYRDVTFTITLQESGGGIWGGNVNAGLGFAYDGDFGNWEAGLVSTEGAGSFAGGSRSYLVELSISGGDELSDLDGTTMEIGGSENTSLYRAVGPDELANIQQNRLLRKCT